MPVSNQSRLTSLCIYPLTGKMGLVTEPISGRPGAELFIACSNLRSAQRPDSFALCWGLGVWGERWGEGRAGRCRRGQRFCGSGGPTCFSASSWRHGPVQASTAWILSALLWGHLILTASMYPTALLTNTLLRGR